MSGAGGAGAGAGGGGGGGGGGGAGAAGGGGGAAATCGTFLRHAADNEQSDTKSDDGEISRTHHEVTLLEVAAAYYKPLSGTRACCDSRDGTIAPWNICCARRRGPRRGISGSAASAGSSRRSFVRRCGAGPLRVSSTAAAAQAPTWSCSADSAAPMASTCRRSAFGLRVRRAGRPSPAPRSPRRPSPAGPSTSSPRSTSCIRSRSRTKRRPSASCFALLKPGGYAVINVAAMPMLTGDHSVLSHERRRYTRPSLRRLLEGAGFTIERLTYTNATLFLPLAMVRGGSPVARARRPRPTRSRRSPCRPGRQ